MKRLLPALLLFLLFIAYTLSTSDPILLPSEGEPAVLYTTDMHQDLQKVMVKAIDQAEKSILVIIYNLSDDHVIRALKRKAEEGVKVTVILDSKTGNPIKRLGSEVKSIRHQGEGLMHIKALVVDEHLSLIGSANFSYDSLRVHSNLMIALEHPRVAHAIEELGEQIMQGKGASLSPSYARQEEQLIEIWPTHDSPESLDRLKELINQAEDTLKIAMFTWTHHELADAIIAAHSRGVNVELVLDRKQATGSGFKVTKKLKKAGIPLYFNRGPGLLHDKTMLIDDRILVAGSANWTKAAFNKNEDWYFVFNTLNTDQQEFMKKRWNILITESDKQKN